MTAPLRTAEIIAVGSELLGWTRLDTNSLFITEQLSRLGIELMSKTVVGDDRRRIRDLVTAALDRADLVVLCGGLGPTDDDLTREAVAEALGLPLAEDEAITAHIRQRFESRGLTMAEVNRRQAMVPEGATVLPNTRGSAPGLLIPAGERLAVLLPGPPRELQPMLAALCEPPARSPHAPAASGSTASHSSRLVWRSRTSRNGRSRSTRSGARDPSRSRRRSSPAPVRSSSF